MESLSECECELGIASLLPPEIYHGFFNDIEPSELPAAPVLNLPVPPHLNAGIDELSSQQPVGAVLDDTELEIFVNEQKNVNTKRKTQSDLRRWHNWCRSVGESREIGDIPPGELDRLLGHFYEYARLMVKTMSQTA